MTFSLPMKIVALSGVVLIPSGTAQGIKEENQPPNPAEKTMMESKETHSSHHHDNHHTNADSLIHHWEAGFEEKHTGGTWRLIVNVAGDLAKSLLELYLLKKLIGHDGVCDLASENAMLTVVDGHGSVTEDLKEAGCGFFWWVNLTVGYWFYESLCLYGCKSSSGEWNCCPWNRKLDTTEKLVKEWASKDGKNHLRSNKDLSSEKKAALVEELRELEIPSCKMYWCLKSFQAIMECSIGILGMLMCQQLAIFSHDHCGGDGGAHPRWINVCGKGKCDNCGKEDSLFCDFMIGTSWRMALALKSETWCESWFANTCVKSKIEDLLPEQKTRSVPKKTNTPTRDVQEQSSSVTDDQEESCCSSTQRHEECCSCKQGLPILTTIIIVASLLFQLARGFLFPGEDATAGDGNSLSEASDDSSYDVALSEASDDSSYDVAL